MNGLGSLDQPRADMDVVSALRAGCPETYERFVRAQRAPLMRLGVRLLRSEQEAEDCFQEVMFKVGKAIHAFDGRASLGTWVWRIMRNTCLMRLRKRSRSLEVLTAAAPEGSPHAMVRPCAERGLEAEDCAQVVHRAIGCLPERYREIVLLRDFDDLSTAEVAERLGINPGNAKVRLHRARAALRVLIEAQAEAEWLQAYRTGP
ncbi:MAG: RNA polymerase sigma factor [Sandaracinaceae bacterium]